MVPWVVGKIGVSAVGVGLPASCRLASRGSSWLDMEFEIGVATVCVSRPCVSTMCRFDNVVSYGILRLVYFLILCRRRITSVVSYGIRRLIYVMYKMFRRSGNRRRNSRRRFVIEKIIPKPKIFTETGTQDSFRVCALSSCNLLAETNKVALGAFLL
jgi:hypothetical protein